MKSYQVVEFGEPLELREYENPQPKGDEVLVKITACGVCHSDLHLACLLYTSDAADDW